LTVDCDHDIEQGDISGLVGGIMQCPNISKLELGSVLRGPATLEMITYHILQKSSIEFYDIANGPDFEAAESDEWQYHDFPLRHYHAGVNTILTHS
jgi:hypothetical protein